MCAFDFEFKYYIVKTPTSAIKYYTKVIIVIMLFNLPIIINFTIIGITLYQF